VLWQRTGRTALTEIDTRQPSLQVIAIIVIVFRVRKGIVIAAILFEALQEIHHRLTLLGRRRWFRVDVGR
jgi:hypothetical protein